MLTDSVNNSYIFEISATNKIQASNRNANGDIIVLSSLITYSPNDIASMYFNRSNVFFYINGSQVATCSYLSGTNLMKMTIINQTASTLIINDIELYVTGTKGDTGPTGPTGATGPTGSGSQALGGTGQSSAGGSLDVNFNTTVTIPIVTATVYGTSPAIITVNNVGPTGFSANTYNLSGTQTGPVDFNWNVTL
jgi:hypothetical protein